MTYQIVNSNTIFSMLFRVSMYEYCVRINVRMRLFFFSNTRLIWCWFWWFVLCKNCHADCLHSCYTTFWLLVVAFVEFCLSVMFIRVKEKPLFFFISENNNINTQYTKSHSSCTQCAMALMVQQANWFIDQNAINYGIFNINACTAVRIHKGNVPTIVMLLPTR